MTTTEVKATASSSPSAFSSVRLTIGVASATRVKIDATRTAAIEALTILGGLAWGGAAAAAAAVAAPSTTNSSPAAQQWYTTGAAVDIIPFAAKSGVNEQPEGDDETLRGATNRLNALVAHFRAPSYTGTVPHLFVSLENGLCRVHGVGTMDFAWIIIEHGVTKRRVHVRSATVMLPESLVFEAYARTFTTTTVGQTLVDHHKRLTAATTATVKITDDSTAAAAADTVTSPTGSPILIEQPSYANAITVGADPHDPHAYLTGGVMGRQPFLYHALLSAMGQLHYQLTATDGLIDPLVAPLS